MRDIHQKHLQLHLKSHKIQNNLFHSLLHSLLKRKPKKEKVLETIPEEQVPEVEIQMLPAVETVPTMEKYHLTAKDSMEIWDLREADMVMEPKVMR